MDGVLRILGDAKGEIENKINNLPNSGAGVGQGTLTNILYWIYAMGGLIAVAIIIYGAIKYNTSQGDAAKTKQASQIIAFAVVGLIIVMLAGAITAFVTGAIGEAAQ